MSENADLEAMRGRLAELEAAQRDSRGGAPKGGGGFGRGFFGCFGVLAAIVLCLVALFFCSAVGEGVRQSRVSDGVASGRDYAPNCAAGLVQVTKANPRIRGATVSMDAMVLSAGDMPLIACGASTAQGSLSFSVQIICGDALARGCNQVRRVDLDGEALRLP